MPYIDEDTDIDRPVTFRKTYATNVLVGMSEYDFRIEFFNERMRAEKAKKWIYFSEGMAILTPLAAKRLRDALSEKIDQYEGKCGKIKEDRDLPVMMMTVKRESTKGTKKKLS